MESKNNKMENRKEISPYKDFMDMIDRKYPNESKLFSKMSSINMINDMNNHPQLNDMFTDIYQHMKKYDFKNTVNLRELTLVRNQTMARMRRTPFSTVYFTITEEGHNHPLCKIMDKKIKKIERVFENNNQLMQIFTLDFYEYKEYAHKLGVRIFSKDNDIPTIFLIKKQLSKYFSEYDICESIYGLISYESLLDSMENFVEGE